MKAQAFGVLLGSVAAAAVAAPPRTATVPSAQMGDVRLRLRQVTLERRTTVTYAPTGIGPGARVAAVRAVLDFELGSRTAGAVESLAPALAAGKPPRFSAKDQNGRIARSVRGELITEEERPLLRITVEGLPPGARTLAELSGELPTYPKAQRIRFHVPWLKDELPLSVETDGATATLRRFQLVGADSTLWVGLRPPQDFRVAPASIVARAIDIDGNLVNGGGITRIEQTGQGATPEFRFFAPELRRTPSRLMLDVLCVSGAVRPVPFRLTHIPLP